MRQDQVTREKWPRTLGAKLERLDIDRDVELSIEKAKRKAREIIRLHRQSFYQDKTPAAKRKDLEVIVRVERELSSLNDGSASQIMKEILKEARRLVTAGKTDLEIGAALNHKFPESYFRLCTLFHAVPRGVGYSLYNRMIAALQQKEL